MSRGSHTTTRPNSSPATFLQASNSPDHDKNQNKRQLVVSYRIGQYAHLLTSAIIMFAPDRTKTIPMAKKLGGGAGFGVAAGLCHILAGACSHGRLRSDTYKRINLGLLGFSLISILAVPAEAGILSAPIFSLAATLSLSLLKVYTSIIAAIGWQTGSEISTIKDMVKEIVQGTKDTWHGLFNTTKKGVTYRNCLILIVVGIMSTLLEGIFLIRYKEAFIKRQLYTGFTIASDMSLQWSGVGRLFMISTMIASLKDAAERDRLTGTTFIEMNILIGLWAFITGVGQSLYHHNLFVTERGIAMFTLSLVFLVKAFTSQIRKNKKIEST
jgi:hypothetical protein